MNAHKKTMEGRIQHLLDNPLVDQRASDEYYKQWAATYEAECQSVNYASPQITAQYFHKHAKKHGLPEDCEILDVAAGTGLCGHAVKVCGYERIDAIDPCEEMLTIAEKKRIYRKHFVSAAGNGVKMPIDNDAYDAALISGSLLLINSDGLEEMIRVIKPGGLFVSCGKVRYVDHDAPWMMPTLNKMEEDGIVEKLEIDIPKENHYENAAALVLVYKKL